MAKTADKVSCNNQLSSKSCSKCSDCWLCVLLPAGGSQGEGHLGVPAGALPASNLDVTEPEAQLASHSQSVTESSVHQCPHETRAEIQTVSFL